uniref:Uncharacterized protein n=2 Tax=Populus TaxID=3689 RepID=A9PCD6_POPTR|nr:unknown [Populus trichocarpa]ABK96538.1 unknown [Populus trichocarpa x Populus deltoides]
MHIWQTGKSQKRHGHDSFLVFPFCIMLIIKRFVF